ncbi:phosphatidylglycerophosphatase A [Thalassotalea sp. LPB0316]|uniref:phosphatidylglycerophosphatase A family protein n=1 Tax=Thalassotalea sp. LPB0316 TaxID=2769490 RepID=UPI001868BBCD|nr:phosphatidylglycerophosphatase A [Thalassotalea sp. LPB0316]QOL24397.1 phosphatidylglycerophosphatase A [Thalassotalea sp. LPB0316]
MSGKFKISDPVQFLALGFGTGLAPKAPGTFGTLAAIPIFILIADLPLSQYLAVLSVMALFGVHICGYAAKAVGVKDHPAIVWDEIVGYMITMIMMPINATTIIVGFLLFRFFDVLKPWPISAVDKKLHSGLGIMLDDMIAGLMAFAVMQLIFNVNW